MYRVLDRPQSTVLQAYQANADVTNIVIQNLTINRDRKS